MSVPSWAHQSVRLNEVEGVYTWAGLPRWSLMNNTSVAKYLQTLTEHVCYAHYHCRGHLYQRTQRRNWFGIQGWDSGSPTLRTLLMTFSPVTLWPVSIAKSHGTSLCARVSLLSYLVIETKQQILSVLLIPVSVWQPLSLKMWRSPQIVSECWLETPFSSTVLVRPLSMEESTSHGSFHGWE